MTGAIINRVLQVAGLRLCRVPRQSKVAESCPPPAETEVMVGAFAIAIPSDSPLISIYASIHGYGANLTRLAAFLGNAIPDLEAVDVGANVGDTLALIHMGFPCPCLCIEGDQRCSGFLLRNLRHFAGSRAVSAWLGERSEAVMVSMVQVGTNTTIGVPPAEGDPVRISLQALDDLVDGEPTRARMRLLKCDTEGYDLRILRGARRFLRDVRPVLFFEYNRQNLDPLGESGLDTLRFLRDMGYDRVVIYDEWGRLLLGCSLVDQALLADLHDYADGRRGRISYYDITVFHAQDACLAEQYRSCEAEWRRSH